MQYTTEEIYGVLEPLSLLEVKQEIKVDYDDDDGLIFRYIAAARRYCENYTGLSLKKKTYVVLLDQPEDFEENTLWIKRFNLPFGPASEQNVVSLHYQNNDGVFVEVEPEDYHVEGLNFLSVRLASVVEISSRWRKRAVYRVVYQAGYEYGTVPEDILKAMLQLVGDMYENRNNSVSSANSQTSNISAVVTYSTKQLLAPYRRKTLF